MQSEPKIVWRTENWKGKDGTIGYTGEWCPFTFYFETPVSVINLQDYYPEEGDPIISAGGDTYEQQDIYVSTKKILWDFGDGETYLGLSQRHWYKNPGIYEVKCTFFDSKDIQYQNEFSNYIQVSNYVSDYTGIQSYQDLSQANLIYSKRFPVNLKQTISQRNQDSLRENTELLKLIVQFDYIKKTDISPEPKWIFTDQERDQDQWSHLYPSIRFSNGTTHMDTVSPTWRELFVSLDPITKEPTLQYDSGDYFAGLVQDEKIYLTVDIPQISSGVIWASLDPTYIKDISETNQVYEQVGLEPQQYINMVSKGLSTTSISYPLSTATPSDRIVFTQNGMTDLSSFNINSTKFLNYPFMQVAQIQHSHLDENNEQYWENSLYNPAIPLSSISITDENNVELSTSDYELSALSTSYDNGGHIKLLVNVKNIQDGSNEMKIKIKQTDVTVQLSGSTYQLNDQYSDIITIIDQQKRTTKINEDFDIQTFFRDIKTQEILNDKEILYNNFFPEQLGDENSDENFIGKKLYEKIQNFTMNKRNMDTCEITALKDQMEMVGMYDLGSDITRPEQVERLVNLLSIKQSVLVGEENTNAENFYKKGFDIASANTENELGINLGQEIDLSSYIFDVNQDNFIVSYEKFQEKYTLINTNFYVDTDYELSALSQWNLSALSTSILNYQDRWGWGLVLPDGFLSTDIPKFYKFYYHLSTQNGNVDGIIDFENDRNEITRAEYKDGSYLSSLSIQIQELFTKNLS